MKFFFLFLFSLGVLHAQTPQVVEALSSPRSTMKTFLKAMKDFKLTKNIEAKSTALETIDLGAFDTASRQDSGWLAAKKLVQTLDKLEYIKYENIPDKPAEDIWYFRKQNVIVDGKSYPVEIAISQQKNSNWLFTQRTIETIDTYYNFVKDQKSVEGVVELVTWKTRFKEKMPAWTGKKTLLLLNGQWLGLLLVIFIGFFLDRLFKTLIVARLTSILKKKNIDMLEKRKDNFANPFGLSILSLTWLMGIRLLEFNDSTLSLLLRGGQVFLTITIVWGAYRTVDVISYYFENLARKSENKFDDIMVPLLRKSAKVFIICIGTVFICHSLTLNVTNILAGLGIGGLAFALAAKDTLSNLFGSLTVVLDRPFHIGDWVNIGGNIDGTVVEVGFRSTRIRTFYDSLITVPNSQLTNIHIDNYGKRTYRRLSTKINLQYDTPPQKIEAFCEGIRQLILSHKFTRKDNFHVYLNAMGAHSLDILLYVFWKVPSWSDELLERHRLLIDILRLGHRLEVEFAFPTQTLHLFNQQMKSNTDITEDSHELGKQAANELFNNPITQSQHRSGLKPGSSSLPESKYGF